MTARVYSRLVVQVLVLGVGAAAYYLGRAAASAPDGQEPQQHLTR